MVILGLGWEAVVEQKPLLTSSCLPDHRDVGASSFAPLALVSYCHTVKNIKPTKKEESDGRHIGVLTSFSGD